MARYLAWLLLGLMLMCSFNEGERKARFKPKPNPPPTTGCTIDCPGTRLFDNNGGSPIG